jgi:hypothetical protein
MRAELSRCRHLGGRMQVLWRQNAGTLEAGCRRSGGRQTEHKMWVFWMQNAGRQGVTIFFGSIHCIVHFYNKKFNTLNGDDSLLFLESLIIHEQHQGTMTISFS